MPSNPSEIYRTAPAPFYVRMGRLIRGAREAKGLSQEAVGNRLRVTAATVGFWESGSRRIQVDRLPQLAHVLDTSIDYLLSAGSSPDDMDAT
jgi:repressor LexA